VLNRMYGLGAYAKRAKTAEEQYYILRYGAH
jgi:hypothetical protein